MTVSKDEAPPVLTGLSFETPAAQAPQDEVNLILTVRSAAKPRVFRTMLRIAGRTMSAAVAKAGIVRPPKQKRPPSPEAFSLLTPRPWRP